ncbi:hypothetical protein AMR72_15740 [Flavobacterium psychrophilum]|nr:hypothetical protein AMR72_15740 [Flavobacterium psychrophilum]AOE53830.1 hypothetical protein ALW18_15730 [Flavobacterium psychrophilum]
MRGVSFFIMKLILTTLAKETMAIEDIKNSINCLSPRINWISVNIVCPGWTKTDFTNHQGTSTVEEAGKRIVKYALIGNDGPTGQYFREEYFPAPANFP